MLTIIIPAQNGQEMWDPYKEEFVYKNPFKGAKLTLEHSLVSISKWESKYKKAFLKKNKTSSCSDLTQDEILYYVKCMTIEKNIPDVVYDYLTEENVIAIKEYIEDPMTASVINTNMHNNSQMRDTVTSELIYYWMIANEIPFECEKWHLNRLLTLIGVCAAKNSQGGSHKVTKDLLKNQNALNLAQRRKFNTRG